MLSWIFAAAAVICLLYYGLLVLYAGFGTSFAALWLFFCGFFGAAAAGVWYYQRDPERMKLWLPVSLVTLCASGLIVLIVVQILIFGRIPDAAEPNLDYVIVLGARVKPEGLSRTLRLRLDKAAEYAAENPDTVFVLSGGKGADEPCTEAEAMRDYLLLRGISAEKLVLEEQSHSTVENIAYSRQTVERMAEGRSPRIGILTSNFHLYRARLIAEKQGLEDVCGIAAESDRVMFVHFCLRDGLALLKDRLMGNL